MASAIGVLQLTLLAAAIFAVGIALLTALIYPRVRGLLTAIPPRQRAPVLRWICTAPAVGALVLTSMCLLPSALGMIWPEFDHCLTHHGHVHICLVHPPATAGNATGWAFNAIFWGLMASGAVSLLWRVIATAGALRGLEETARYDSVLGVCLVTSLLPFCVVSGLIRPKVLLSTALHGALPETALRIVLAHERGHVRRRDSLWHFVAALLSVAHLPPLRQRLLADLALASECACDEDAAAAVGDRVRVASAIVAVERLLTDRSRVLGPTPAFGGSDVAARVEALLNEPDMTRSAWRRAMLIGLAVITMALAPPGALHHWTETLLGLLTN